MNMTSYRSILCALVAVLLTSACGSLNVAVNVSDLASITIENLDKRADLKNSYIRLTARKDAGGEGTFYTLEALQKSTAKINVGEYLLEIAFKDTKDVMFARTRIGDRTCAPKRLTLEPGENSVSVDVCEVSPEDADVEEKEFKEVTLSIRINILQKQNEKSLTMAELFNVKDLKAGDTINVQTQGFLIFAGTIAVLGQKIDEKNYLQLNCENVARETYEKYKIDPQKAEPFYLTAKIFEQKLSAENGIQYTKYILSNCRMK